MAKTARTSSLQLLSLASSSPGPSVLSRKPSVLRSRTLTHDHVRDIHRSLCHCVNHHAIMRSKSRLTTTRLYQLLHGSNPMARPLRVYLLQRGPDVLRRAGALRISSLVSGTAVVSRWCLELPCQRRSLYRPSSAGDLRGPVHRSWVGWELGE